MPVQNKPYLVKTDGLTKLVYKYDSDMRVREVCGIESDPLYKEIVWERYDYSNARTSDSGADIHAVTLFNPRRGSIIRVTDTRKIKLGYPLWLIESEDDTGEFIESGEAHIFFDEDTIAMMYINVEKGQREGIARAVMHWLGLMTYRERKKFYIGEVTHPGIERIASTIYGEDVNKYDGVYGTTYDDLVNAEAIARHQRADLLISRIQRCTSPLTLPDLASSLVQEAGNDSYRLDLMLQVLNMAQRICDLSAYIETLSSRQEQLDEVAPKKNG